jgi:hypothetical protein
VTISNIPTRLETALGRIKSALALDGVQFVWGVIDDNFWIESDFDGGYQQTSWYPVTVNPSEVMRDFNIE